jgi:bifunctional DNase/RNase
VTNVRIVIADPRSERVPVGSAVNGHHLIVLADDAGHRALPIRLRAYDRSLWRLLARPEDRNDEEHQEDQAEEMTGRLLDAAGITVTGVTVTDLGPEVTATRIDIAAHGANRQVTTRLADGLTLAVITGAPLAVEDPVMDRLAEPVTGPDLLSPFRRRQQPPLEKAGRHRRFEPRNMAFTDDLDGWRLAGTFLRQGAGFDYSGTTEDGRAILTAATPEPAGFAILSQDIFADDYRGRAVTLRGDVRATGVEDLAGLALRVQSEGRPTPQQLRRDPRLDPDNHFAFVTGTRDWTQHEVTAEIPPDANLIIFGVFLNGPGQIELRNPQLEPHPADQQQPRLSRRERD